VDTLASRLDAALAVRDSESVRRLCDDVRAVAERDGEATGLAMADMLLYGVRAYEEYNLRLRPIGVGASGEVLGERMPMEGVPCWWMGNKVTLKGSKFCVKALMGHVKSGSHVPTEATHWHADGEKGWWRAPLASDMPEIVTEPDDDAKEAA